MDHEKLPSSNVSKADHAFNYFESSGHNYPGASNWLDSNLQQTSTAAFLVIKNDSVLYEKYFDQYTRQTLLPSFSVAKSFVSTLVGMAIEEGKIKSVYEPLTNYVPELLQNDERFSQISIQHLLDMRSGIKWSEGSYGLKDDAIKMGFRPNMMRYIKKIKITSTPKEDSDYKSINTLLLGIIITRATGKTLTQYLDEKIWHPLGMESHATWNTDKKKLPITFGGLNATARDFAKLGTLFLKKGVWNGKSLISGQWVNSSTSKDSMAAYGGYRNQWWGVSDYKYFSDSAAAVAYNKNSGSVPSYVSKNGTRYFYVREQSNSFFAEGILGQFVYVVPDKNIVIVRLGYYWNHPKFNEHAFLKYTQTLY